jgi:hypothetical protein
MTPDPRTDPATFIETLLTEVCFGDEGTYPLEVTIGRYFTPDYQQRTDGELSGRDGFAGHIRALRDLIASGRVTVREALCAGDRIADRHEVTVTRRDGSTSRVEIYLFGELAGDGRLRRVDELTRVLDGSQDDAGLATVR